LWFLTIESIALLAIATTLGLFSGWLVWGGRPAVIAPPTPLLAIPSVSDLTPTSTDDDEFALEFPAARILEAAKADKARKLSEAARLTAAEIDPEAAEQEATLDSAVDRNSSLVPLQTNEAELVAVTSPLSLLSATPVVQLLSNTIDGTAAADVNGPQNLSSTTEANGSNGNNTTNATNATKATNATNATNTAQLRIAELESDLSNINERLTIREADVVRLKTKLRKAVEEIEKRTALAQAARAELVDHQQLLARSITESTSGSQQAFAATAEHDDFAPAGTRFTPAEIDELVQARTASLHIQTSQLERRTALIQSRAEEAEARVIVLKAEVSQTQADAEAMLAKAEHDANNRILSLEVDLASARQRTNMATQELMGFGSEISAIRDTNAKHLQSVHETMRDLQHRLDTTKAALAGRSIPAVQSSNAESVVDGNGQSSLLVLPGMTATLIDALAELGVRSLHDVSSWTTEDVEHMQSWLPEDPAIVERNGWVAFAQRSLRENSASRDA
jgi:hypothetical protein